MKLDQFRSEADKANLDHTRHGTRTGFFGVRYIMGRFRADEGHWLMVPDGDSVSVHSEYFVDGRWTTKDEFEIELRKH